MYICLSETGWKSCCPDFWDQRLGHGWWWWWGGEDLHLADLLFTRNSLFRKKFHETVRFESWFKVHFIH